MPHENTPTIYHLFCPNMPHIGSLCGIDAARPTGREGIEQDSVVCVACVDAQGHGLQCPACGGTE
jgi:hypothetical protein